MRARSKKVADYCTHAVASVDRAMPVVDCAKRMHDDHVGSLVVVDTVDGRKVPVGMLTDRDIAIEVVAFGMDASALTAGDIMSSDLATARKDDDLLAALARMRSQGVRRLPVVDATGALAGVLAADDLLAVVAEEINGLAQVVDAQATRERTLRTASGY
jgi:predicted transcriptional regulator